MEPKFLVDHNVAKLARWLRMIGYDALLFQGEDDGQMVRLALAQGRVLLTKDTQIMLRRVVAEGRVKAVLIEVDEPREQLRQVVEALGLDYGFNPFSRCLECNALLQPRDQEAVRHLVPPYVYRTRNRYVQCPTCQRVYWQGTHWQAMRRRLAELSQGAYQ
ncbi:MAG TPA: hypothetical protein G4O03_00970 [Dehalococcoidia bacterium]|jgi:hypothetical protein|nr:hypothetical protein [Dehalococcoidia bacterium]